MGEKNGGRNWHDLHFYVSSMKTEMERENPVDCTSSIIQKLFLYFQTKSAFRFAKNKNFFSLYRYNTALLSSGKIKFFLFWDQRKALGAPWYDSQRIKTFVFRVFRKCFQP